MAHTRNRLGQRAHSPIGWPPGDFFRHASIIPKQSYVAYRSIEGRRHLRSEERRLIHKVFEFSDTLVREAMVPRTVSPRSRDSTLEQIVKAFEQNVIRGFRSIANQLMM